MALFISVFNNRLETRLRLSLILYECRSSWKCSKSKIARRAHRTSCVSRVRDGVPRKSFQKLLEEPSFVLD